MARYRIGPVGPTNAKLAVVAEKPGKDELAKLLETGRSEPLIGASGRDVDYHLRRAGIPRDWAWLTNSVEEFDELGNPTDADIQREQVRLYMELLQLPNLNCIIALGKAALLSLTNFAYSDISKRRGSILTTPWGCKLVPTFHPAFYFRGEWRFKSVVGCDFLRAAHEAQTRDLTLPTIRCHIEPTYDEAISWLRFLGTQPEIAFDIELFRGRYISCIAFSHNGEDAFCIPLAHGSRKEYWTTEQEIGIWQAIQYLLLQPKKFFTQNGMFDCWHLWRHGIVTPHMDHGFDTMLAHQLLAPDLPHTLDFITSIYTRIPYYKDESGKWDKEIAVPDEQFWGYNCKDAIATWLCAQALREDLAEFGQLEYFQTCIQPQWSPYMAMRQTGWKVDVKELIAMRSKLINETIFYNTLLKDQLGWIPNVKSPLDIGKVLTQLRVNPRYTKTGKVKHDEKMMLAYAKEVPAAFRDVFTNFMEVARRRTLEAGFLGLGLNEGERYHAGYRVNKARTGRSSGEGSDEGGPQPQNIPGHVRYIFIADSDDHELHQADLKQAEAMIVAWDAQDPQLIEAFETGKDVHRVRACRMYRDWLADELPPDSLLDTITVICPKCVAALGRPVTDKDKCNHSERQVTKVCGHALAYKMGIGRLIDTLIKADVYIDTYEANRIKRALVTPYILEWQNRVEWELKKNAVLTGPLGRKREFYGLLDEDMIRAALSWKAQHVVGDICHRALIFLHKNLPKGASLRTQTHDSVVVNALKSQREEVSQLIEKAFDQTIYYHERPLRIPIETSIGRTW